MTKVAHELHVTKQALGKWSSRWNWVERARVYDNWMAKAISERVARRLAEQADSYSRIASDRLGALTPAEKASLTLQETALCSKLAAELAGRERAELVEKGLSEGLPKVVFNIQLIASCPPDTVTSGLGTTLTVMGGPGLSSKTLLDMPESIRRTL